MMRKVPSAASLLLTFGIGFVMAWSAGAQTISLDNQTVHVPELSTFVDTSATATAPAASRALPSYIAAQIAADLPSAVVSMLASLPTTDPKVAGALWNNAGLIMESSGP